MSIASRFDSGILYISVNGRFDFAVHHEFLEAIKLLQNDIKSTEIDLSGTSYLDSSALGMLLMLHDKLSAAKLSIQLINPPVDVRRILEIANFDKLFTLN